MTLGVEHILAFNIALLAALAAPGPALIYCVRETLTGGISSGWVAALGLATCAALWTTAALFGLTTFFALFPWAYAALKIGGGAFLVWIAWRTWRDAGQDIDFTGKGSSGRRFLRAFLINLGNPKSAFFAAAVLVLVFPPTMSLADKALIVANQLVLEACFYGGFALIMSRNAVAAAYRRFKAYIDRCAAFVMGGLGLRLATLD